MANIDNKKPVIMVIVKIGNGYNFLNDTLIKNMETAKKYIRRE